jgi:hypothetical protein
MEKRPVAGISHSNDTKHRIVRFAGQPLPDVAFERPQPDLPGLVWLNRPSSGAADLLPDVTELEAYWTVARKDPALAPYALQKLEELAKSAPNDSVVLTCLGAVALSDEQTLFVAATLRRHLVRNHNFLRESRALATCAPSLPLPLGFPRYIFLATWRQPR